MKRTIVLAFAVISLLQTIQPSAQAQTCYTPITSFQGNYTLKANEEVSCGDGDETCKINQSAAGEVGTIGVGVSCTQAQWISFDTLTSASLNDTDTEPCPSLPPQITTLTGTGGGFSSITFLTIEPVTGTYTFFSDPSENWKETVKGCNSNTSKSGSAAPLFPLNNWPLTFSLPAKVQELTDVNLAPFLAQADFQGATVLWTLSFTRDPIYDPDDCKQEGHSIIGCQSQSLGEVVPIVGTGFNLHYRSSRLTAGGNSVASADAAMIGGWTLSVHHAYDPNTHTLFVGDGTERKGYELGNPVRFNGHLLITSEDGSEVYVFTTAGQHLQTLRPMTGAVEYQFTYDAAGNLINVIDAVGNLTKIQRNASEQPTAIVSPFGQVTTLAVDNKGFLSKVTDPLGKSATFVNTSAGLLTSRTDENGNIFNYTYDSSGRLTEDSDSLGGFTKLARTNAPAGFGWTVGESTAMGVTSSYQTTLELPWIQDGTKPVSEQHTNTWPNGLKATSSSRLQNGQLSDSFALPDSMTDSATSAPDPVWGIQQPVVKSETLTKGNLTMNITGSRTTTLATAGNPFIVNTETDSQTVNSRTYTSTFTGLTRSWVRTSPVGRTVTLGLDSLERLSSAQIGGLTATTFTYDSRGRLASATQTSTTDGTRKFTFAYNSQGFVASVTDPMLLKTSFAYDADGRPLTTTLPDGRMVDYTYDANGNRTATTPPGKSAHNFAYNAVDLLETYTPPAAAETGPTTYAYDLDRNLTSVTLPDGERINYGYDTAGRLISLGTPTGTTTLTYDSTTGDLATAARGVEHTAYSYDGPLPTMSTLTGTVAGSVSRTYDNNFWVTAETINGTSSMAFQHDNDGLLTKAGSLTIARNSQNGLITGATLGLTTDSRTYNTFGELIGYNASVNGTPVYKVSFTRDADGRVTAKTETIAGATNSYVYSYDVAGRLTKATKNNTTDTYAYDTNSNRLSATNLSGTVTGTYDAQDRLLKYGAASYAYTANGELTTQTVGAQTTSYTNDVLGNLIAAILPKGTKITYIIDGENHRVGKEVNGVLQTGFLHDGNQIVAQLNGNNQLLSQFIYATGSNSPDYMISGGVTYRIFSDHLGSPILIVNAVTGAIAEQITYDEFGNVMKDTNPGFQPFGFAGGLYDRDTKLVRFGARDYDPNTGRWTAKDPIRFSGGDSNLYGYVWNDPVNISDPAGLEGDCACEQKDSSTINNYTGGFVDEYTELGGIPVLGPWGLILKIKFGTTSPTEVVRILMNDTSVDKGSSAYVAGQFTVDVISSLFGGREAGSSAGKSILQVLEEGGSVTAENKAAARRLEKILERTAQRGCGSKINSRAGTGWIRNVPRDINY